MKSKILPILMSAVIIGGSTSLVSADSAYANYTSTKEVKIETARDYINKSSSQLIEILEELQIKEEEISYSDIKGIINKYYLDNPAPTDIFNDQSISINDVFPNEINEIDYNNAQNFNLNDFIEEQKNNDKILTFSTENSTTDVFVDKLGIFILNNEIEPNSSSSSVQPMATWKYTSNQRVTGAAYNSLGLEMFELWASGSFKYDGSKVEVATKDGNYDRKFWGATLNLTPLALGQERMVSIEGYRYAEVYSRLSVDTQLGIRWFGVTISQNTVEAKIGSTIAGNVYTGTSVID